ncbi:MAG: hypothetical protein EBU88_17215, partial [Acidobacteria bacterium]|nr:hypothetical protein [Acidobacteriota bacterium]
TKNAIIPTKPRNSRKDANYFSTISISTHKNNNIIINSSINIKLASYRKSATTINNNSITDNKNLVPAIIAGSPLTTAYSAKPTAHALANAV